MVEERRRIWSVMIPPPPKKKTHVTQGNDAQTKTEQHADDVDDQVETFAVDLGTLELRVVEIGAIVSTPSATTRASTMAPRASASAPTPGRARP